MFRFQLRPSTHQLPLLAALAGGAASLAACAQAPGEVTILVEPERTVQDGIFAGSGPEEIQDGWDVTFTKYILTLGPVELAASSGQLVARAPARWALDLVQIPPSGEPLWTFEELGEGRYDVRYQTVASESERHSSVTSSDFERLMAEQLTHLIVGAMTNPSGVSCPPASLAMPPADATIVDQNAAGDDCYAARALAFVLEARAEVTYGPCSVDGLPGVAVRAGERTTAAISMHGDHLFFGGFPEGSEGQVLRYAQWLADSDLDVDGTVTTAELETIPPALLPELDERFPLAGSPVRPLESLLDYVESQLSTQGHFEGEGECAVGFLGLGGAPP